MYDPDQATVGYAEDVTKLDDEVVAIETELGANPKGSHDSVADRFSDDEALLNDHSARHENGGADEISVEGLAGQLGESQPKGVQMVVFDFTADVATGDGKFYFRIDPRIAGMNLVDIHARVITAGTTGNLDIQIHNLTTAADMLSVLMRVETGETGTETSAQPGTIDTNEDDVALNDIIRVDIDSVQTTAPKGLIVTLGFALP